MKSLILIITIVLADPRGLPNQYVTETTILIPPIGVTYDECEYKHKLHFIEKIEKSIKNILDLNARCVIIKNKNNGKEIYYGSFG